MGIIVFAGAGASKPLGFPTTAEFFDAKATGFQWTPNHREVYSDLCGFLDSRVIDVEDVLRVLDPASDVLESEAGAFIQQFVLTRSNNSINLNAFRALAEQIKNRCFELYGRTPDRNDVEVLYLKFLDAIGWTEDTVDFFTTNYDLATDRILQIAESRNIPASDGFNKWSRFVPAEYKFRANHGIRVYRLHGSMSWVEEQGEIINNRTISKTNRRHLFIAPGYKGDPKAAREPLPIIHAHQTLEKSLGENDMLIVIGFSFRDPFLNTVFERGFEENEKLSMVYIVPNVPTQSESGFPNIFDKFSSRVEILEKRFGDKELVPAMQDKLEKLGQRFC